MKNFLKNNGLWILFAGAVVAVALAVMSVFSANSSPLVNAAETITAPLRFVSTAVANWFNDRQNYYRDTTALEAENAELRRRLAEMEAAFVTEHAVTNWTSSLTLDKGTRHGVESGDCVIDETGALVGVISECGTNWSTVLTIIDTDVSLGAQVFRTKDLGLAQGNFSLMGQNRLRLDYLPTECRLLSGDLVVSSGLGGYFPAGLVIGSVEEVQRNDAGSASYAILIPSVDFDALEEVFIIKSFDIVT